MTRGNKVMPLRNVLELKRGYLSTFRQHLLPRIEDGTAHRATARMAGKNMALLELHIICLEDALRLPYVYHWHRCGRKGQRCRVTARGAMNSCRVEFDDGFVMITSRNAIRKAPRPVDNGSQPSI